MKTKPSRCPSCEKGILVLRARKADGNKFWGCSDFPACRFTQNHYKRVELESPPDDPGLAEDEWDDLELYKEYKYDE